MRKYWPASRRCRHSLADLIAGEPSGAAQFVDEQRQPTPFCMQVPSCFARACPCTCKACCRGICMQLCLHMQWHAFFAGWLLVHVCLLLWWMTWCPSACMHGGQSSSAAAPGPVTPIKRLMQYSSPLGSTLWVHQAVLPGVAA